MGTVPAQRRRKGRQGRPRRARRPSARRVARWLPWVVGGVLLAALVAAALHFSEGREFVRLAQDAKPWWLLGAVVLQAATYLAQGEVYRAVGRAARSPLPITLAYQLSLSKLFVDNAIPSGGISGTVIVARSLEERGMARTAVMAGVVVNTASFYAAHVLGFAAALLIAVVYRQSNALVVGVTILFVLFGVALSVAALALAGHRGSAVTKRLGRIGPLRRVLELLKDADPDVARNPLLLLEASAYQLAIILLDVATIWVLILALGATGSLPGVFASFMIATPFRTIGVLPGGLGSFEVVSVLTLRMARVGIPVALAATLLFRGLSFWLPMLPGLWFSRHAVTEARRQA
jgi:uncharacterized protein (TIRG00374 family)